jgi:hypothetical protein
MIQRFYNAAAGRRVQSAAVIAYASAGEFARWNPHLHAIFLEDGFDREGRFVHVPCPNLSKLSQYFRASMVAFFLKRTLLNERLARNTITMLSDQSSDSQARLAFAGCTHRAHDPPGSAAPTSCASLRCSRHRRLTARTAPRTPSRSSIGASPPPGPASSRRSTATIPSSVLAMETECGFSQSSQIPLRSTGFFTTSSTSVLFRQGSS